MNLHNRFQAWALLSLCIFVSTLATVEVNSSLSQKPKKSYKIGMLMPFGSNGHYNCFLPLAEALAKRGHEVVIVSNQPGKSKNPKVREINHNLANTSKNMFELRANQSTRDFTFFYDISTKIVREMYDIPEVKEMYEKREEYDLFIIDELFSESSYAFLEGRKYIAIAPPGILPPSSAILGNILNPSYIPSFITDFPQPYSFTQRMMNFFFHISFPFLWRIYGVFPVVQKELVQRFPDLPPLAEIERKGLSLVFANTHFSLDFSMPLLPSQIEVGGMHCRPGQKLPQDLQSFLDGAGPEGVIYFSLGSVAKGIQVPLQYRKIIVDVFSKLKQRVLWKFEEDLEGLPKNIMIKKWLPQQDILAHPNVKLFMTHGGLLSFQESVYHATPLLALPIFADQERTANKIVRKEIGKFLVWETLTVEELKSSIDEIINNPKYKTNIDAMSISFRDQPMTPLDRAVWWTEYAIRHKGAPQLKSPGAALSWIEYLMIDVIITLHLVIFALYWVLKRVFKALFRLCFKSNKELKKKKD